MPKWIIYCILTSLGLAMIPPAVIVRMRTSKSPKPRIHYIQDMDNQAKFKAQSQTALLDNGQPLFSDGRAVRKPVAGTVSRGALIEDDHFTRGVVGGGWASTFPRQTPLDETLIRRGQERFNIYCAMCHGLGGYGDGIVNARAMELLENPFIANGTTWVAPKNIHEPEIREQPVGQLYNTVTNGVRNMAGYAAQIRTEDRWAIVAYVKALERSQYAEPDDVAVDPRSLPIVDLVPKEAE